MHFGVDFIFLVWYAHTPACVFKGTEKTLINFNLGLAIDYRYDIINLEIKRGGATDQQKIKSKRFKISIDL